VLLLFKKNLSSNLIRVLDVINASSIFIGFWLLAVGYWQLAFSCWLLANCFWLLVFLGMVFRKFIPLQLLKYR